MGGFSMTEQEKNWGKMRQKAAKLNNPSPVELPSHSWRCQVMHQGRRISVTDADPAVAHAKVLAIKNGFIQENKASGRNMSFLQIFLFARLWEDSLFRCFRIRCSHHNRLYTFSFAKIL